MLRNVGKSTVNSFEKGMKTFATKAPTQPSTAQAPQISGYDKMIQPKIRLSGVYARYANALYSVAAHQNELENVEKELISMEKSIKNDDFFASYLKDPTIARSSKKDFIANLMKQANLSRPVAGLFEVLAENGRLPDSLAIIDTYKKLMSAYRGEVSAKVISADELTKNELEQVRKALSSRIGKGEKLLLETAVEPNLMGGLQVQMGNYYIDLSLSSKIDKITNVLSNMHI